VRAPRFDAQAESFDRRAGLPPAAVAAIATAVAAAAAPLVDGALLEIGAGTGQIGAALASLTAAHSMDYLGLDLSLSMCARFRARLQTAPATSERGLIAQADADRPWPLAGRARIVFFSRALHLLDAEHVLTEILACRHRAGCAVAVGRVRRDPNGVRGMLRRQMRSLLADRGITGKSGEQAQTRWLAALAAHGGGTRAARTVASWTTEVRPAQVIAAWRGKPGLAGESVPPHLQAEVLDCLQSRAEAELGDLSAPRSTVESYELAVVDLPGPQAAGA
jgi:SAM-dependent methyltransferase